MEHQLLTKLWTDFWDKGLWAAPWQKAVADLSAQQAAWKPSPDRKSIWQCVNHVTFWRNYFLDREAGTAKLSDDEIMKQHFADPPSATEAAWNDARATLQKSHERMIAACKEGKIAAEKLAPPLAHDAYHLGQVMYVRALQGLKPIE